MNAILDKYFFPKTFEKKSNGQIYEKIGVKYIQALALFTLGKTLDLIGLERDREQPAFNYFLGRNPTISDLKKFERGTRLNETVHLLAFILTFDNVFTSSLLDLSVPALNAYLVFLQRYNRTRVIRVIEYKEKRASG